MKKLFSTIAIASVLMFGVSCKKIVNPKSGAIEFSDLTAEKYTLAAGETTKVKATVRNECPSVTYNWEVSSGTVNGSSSEVTFVSSSASQVTVTCTCNHPGRESKTKSITIIVQ